VSVDLGVIVLTTNYLRERKEGKMISKLLEIKIGKENSKIKVVSAG